jgi:hypothetical protein
MDFLNYYFADNKQSFLDEVKKELGYFVLSEDEHSTSLDPVFISGLCNYLEKKFPSFGDLNQVVSIELRKYINGDNAYYKSVRQRIYDIINKLKNKFLKDIENKMEKIQVIPKPIPKSSPIVTNQI